MNALRIRIKPYFGLNTYDFSARRQYPMVGRFDSPDPLAHKTPWLSPYAFCGGDPVNFSDPTGMRIIAAEPGGHFYEWREVEGQWAFYNSNNEVYAGNDSFMLTLTNALTSISGCEEGMRLLSNLVNNANSVIIQPFNKTGWDETASTVGWNMNGANEGVPVVENKIDNNPTINLAHEFAHAEYRWNGGDNSEWFKMPDDSGFLRRTINRSEIYTTFHENLIRKQLGSPLRNYYGKDSYGGRYGPILENGASLFFDVNGNIHYKKIKDRQLRYRF